MATNTSNSVLLDEIDYMAAVSKAMATIYTATYDAFDIMAREQNPDDLTDGVDAAVAVRTRLAAGTGVYTQFSNMTQWLAIRSSAAGSAGLDALLTARGLRAPYSYDQYIQYPSGNVHLTPRNIFYDNDSVMGQFADDGDVFSGGADLAVSGSHNWVVVEVANAGGIAANWVLATTVNYGDGTTGTEETEFAGTEALGAQKNLNNSPLKGLCSAGDTTVLLSTTGMVAGQYVLMVDNTYPVKLSANVATGATELSVSPSQIGWYTPGDHIWISDGNRRETGTVQNINYEYGQVTLESATTKWFLTSSGNTGAYISMPTGIGDGFQEQHAIALVSGANAMSFASVLQHSYSTGGSVQRLVRKVLASDTTLGGGAGYEVTFQTKSERTIAQTAY